MMASARSTSRARVYAGRIMGIISRFRRRIASRLGGLANRLRMGGNGLGIITVTGISVGSFKVGGIASASGVIIGRFREIAVCVVWTGSSRLCRF